MYLPLATLTGIGGEMVILAIVALMLFGRDMPSVMRKVGRVYGQVKRAIDEAGTEIRREMNAAADVVEEQKREIKTIVDAAVPKVKDDGRPVAGVSVPTVADEASHGQLHGQPTAGLPVPHIAPLPAPYNVARSEPAQPPTPPPLDQTLFAANKTEEKKVADEAAASTPEPAQKTNS